MLNDKEEANDTSLDEEEGATKNDGRWQRKFKSNDFEARGSPSIDAPVRHRHSECNHCLQPTIPCSFALE